MKNYLSKEFFDLTKQLFRKMRTTCLLILVFASSLFATNVNSQVAKVSLSIKKSYLIQVLNAIEHQTDYLFVYNKSEIDLTREVNMEVKDQSVATVLSKIFQSTNISYEMEGNNIVLYKIVENAQQQKSVSGKVTDNTGVGLPGVSVVVKGTTTGVITDMGGKYTLAKVPENATLQFSFVGMKTQEIIVGSKTKIDVTLADEAIGIEEVVAVGYGTMKKSDLTGSIVSADLKSFKQSPNLNVMQSLKGSVAGLNISQTTQAGEEAQLSIRGTNSISGSQSPLIVVDNIIYRGSLNDINPNDIQSIDVLKDASATAIYGSQATNGVILITTKQGDGDGKPIISLSSSYSAQSPTKVLRPSNTAQFRQKAIDLDWERSYLAPGYTVLNPAYVIDIPVGVSQEGLKNGVDTDWWGMLTNKNPYIQNHDLSVRGKTDKINYYISAGIADQENLLINDNFKRNTIRINIDNKINSWLTVGIKSFLSASDLSGAAPDMRITNIIPSVIKAYDDKGNIIVQPWFAGVQSPLLRFKMDDLEKKLNLDGVFYAEVKLPVKGLSYKLSASLKRSIYKHYFFNPWGANEQGSGFKFNDFQDSYTLDNILTYKRTFKEVHDLNLTVLYGRENIADESTRVESSNFSNKALGYNSLEAGSSSSISMDTGAWEENSLYSMARLFYSYDNRYMITGTVRRDGFSGFSEKNKFGIFPSVALGWVVSNESFLKENKTISSLKLRTSYGVNGNRTIGRYQTLASVTSSPQYLYGDGGSVVNGQSVQKLPNPDLKWEKTTGLNIGVDFGILNSKINGSIDYYDSKTEDLLYNINIPSINGFTQIATNIGQLNNKGLEINLNGQVMKTKDFSWSVGLNFSRNRNKVVTVLGRDDNKDGKEDDLVASNIFIGQPLGVWYDYQIEGMWQLSDRTAGKIPSGFYPGSFKLADLDNSKTITPDADRKIMGYTDPSYRMGLKNTISYKDFNLLVFFNTVQGGKKYYYGNSDFKEAGWTGGGNLLNYAYPGWDYWTPSNPNSYYPALNQLANVRPTLHQQRNFVRLQDISLSYNLPKPVLEKLRVSSLKLYVSGSNLITWTKWKGWDPEANIGLQTDAYPVMKSYTVGLNVEF